MAALWLTQGVASQRGKWVAYTLWLNGHPAVRLRDNGDLAVERTAAARTGVFVPTGPRQVAMSA